MKTLDDFNFAGRKAIMRVDFNVPLDDNQQISDDTRIKATLPSVKKILDDGGCAVLMSHLGRPKEGPEDKYSLRHLVNHLSDQLGVKVEFAADCIGDEAKEKAGNLQPGQVLLLENLRFHKGETKGDKDFARQLAELGDVYVNDAFGTAHRAHASTAVMAEFFEDKICGYVMQKEKENADGVMERAEKPFTAIMGGAKISDKILIIEKLLERVDNLIIGGGMSYTFFKAMGGKVGNSKVEEDQLDLAKKLLDTAKSKGIEVFLPGDSVIADDFSNDANTSIAASNDIPDGWMGLDIGNEAAEEFANVIKDSKTILWNGPMGVFEMEKFAKGTKTIAEAVVEATKFGAYSLIGGGDSASAVSNLGYENDVSFVSTGGGALLEYFEGRTLPGLAVLEGKSLAEIAE